MKLSIKYGHVHNNEVLLPHLFGYRYFNTFKREFKMVLKPVRITEYHKKFKIPFLPGTVKP